MPESQRPASNCIPKNAPPSIPKQLPPSARQELPPHGLPRFSAPLTHVQKKGRPASPPFNYLVSRRYFMRNLMGSMDSEGKNRSRNSTSISTIRKGAMFRTRLPILMFPMPQTP